MNKQYTLRDQGYKFVKRGGEFVWIHPLEGQPGDINCTFMTDDEFETFVRTGRRVFKDHS